MEMLSAKVDASPAMMTMRGSFVAEATPSTSPRTLTTPSWPPRMMSLRRDATPLRWMSSSARWLSLFCMTIVVLFCLFKRCFSDFCTASLLVQGLYDELSDDA